MLTTLLLTGTLLAASGAAHSDLPVVEVTSDNVRIDQSCVLRVPEGVRIDDADGNGVIHIDADNITVSMAEDSDWLTAPAWAKTPDQRKGIGVWVKRHTGVTLSGLRVRGYATAISTSETAELVIEGCEFRDGFGTRFGEDDQETYDQRGAGTAIIIKDAVSPTVRSTKVRAFEKGLVASNAASIEVYDNDLSYLSRGGVEINGSTDAVIARNQLDGIYGGEGVDVSAIWISGESDRATIAYNAIRNLGPDGTGLLIATHQQDPSLGGLMILRNEFRSMGAAVVADGLADSVIATNAADEIDGWAFNVMGERTVLAMNAINACAGGVKVSGESITVREHAVNDTKTAFEASGEHLVIAKNAAVGCDVGVRLVEGEVQLAANTLTDCSEDVVVDEGATSVDAEVTAEMYEPPVVEVPGENDPTGSEPAMHADYRALGDFFPWDGESVTLHTVSQDGKRHVFEVFGGDENLWATLRSNRASLEWDEASGPNEPARFSVNGPSGVHPYEIRIAQNGKFDRKISGTLLRARWRIDVFEWEVDPQTDHDAWREEAKGKRGRRARTTGIQLDFGDQGPSELSMSGSVIRAKMRHDRFGVIAKSKLPLTPGRYEFVVKIGPDDEVALSFDGEQAAAMRTRADSQGGEVKQILDIEEPRDVEVAIEYVEYTGDASLNLEINLLRDDDSQD